MDFLETTVAVDGEDVRVVAERGDGIYWVPGERHAFQVHRGRRIAGTSFEAFGSDANAAAASERRWIAEAKSWLEDRRSNRR